LITTPQALVEIDFEPEKEVWNLYELSDGTLLRIRTLLIKLFQQKPRPGQLTAQRQYSAAFSNVQSVKKVNPKLRGVPSGVIPSMEELQRSPKVELQFTPLVEDWNVYRLETQEKLRVKLVVTVVHRLQDKWDQFGDPIYITQSQNVIQPIPGQSAIS
jgi:hypothetical protein